MKVFLILFVSLFSPFICSAQASNKIEVSNEKIRLDLKKPSAYVSFDKYDKRKPYSENETSEIIRLKFHNNTKWNMYVKYINFDEKFNDIGLFYEVHKAQEYDKEYKEIKVPFGRNFVQMKRVKLIMSGESVSFAVPKDHLASGLLIVVNFSYEWELNGDIGSSFSIFHQSPFWSRDLPVN